MATHRNPTLSPLGFGALSLGALVLGALIVATPVEAQLCFDRPDSFPTGVNPRAVASGDFDEDGFLDVAVGHLTFSSVSVHFGDGAGGFSGPVEHIPGHGTRDVLAEDLNGDGHLDLAVANYNSDVVRVMLGDGLGGFGPAATYVTGNGAVSLIAEDLDGDTFTDLVVVSLFDDAFTVLLGSATGGFTLLPPVPAGDQPSDIAAGEFTGDVFVDLAVASNITDEVLLFPGDGTGGFGIPTSIPFNFPDRLVAADLDNDTDTDLVVLSSGQASVVLFDGIGGHTVLPGFDPGYTTGSITLEDFDGNGFLDLASTNGPDTVGIFLGDGAGGFFEWNFFATGIDPIDILAGDFNGDGFPDLVTANDDGDSFTLLPGNGTGDFGRHSMFPAIDQHVVRMNPASVDLDGNGIPDVVVASHDSDLSSGQVSILLSDGLGGLGPAEIIPVSGQPISIASSDFNEDGTPDVFTVNRWSGSVSILLGDGTGGLAPPVNYSAGNFPYSATVADFDEDGHVDLAVAGGQTTNKRVGILLGIGDGTFGVMTEFAIDGANPGWIASGDVNEDGHVDVVARTPGTTFWIYLGDGLGGLAPATPLAFEGTIVYGDSLVDLNGDTHLDILGVAAEFGVNAPRTIWLIPGDGQGGFGTPVTWTTVSFVSGLALDDFNQDGTIDIAVDGQVIEIFLSDGLGLLTRSAPISEGSSSDTIVTADFDLDGYPDLVNCETVSRVVRVTYVNACDCNGNGIEDGPELAQGISPDCNGNFSPDECDLLEGTSQDCNGNGLPDECDIASGFSDDCDGNGIPDGCEPTVEDCNGNGIWDACDLANGTSEDCTYNGIPDECDIASGVFLDVNGNLIPDFCEEFFRRGDGNSDGMIDLGDAIFLLDYLFVPYSYSYTDCLDSIDTNDDGALDIGDPIFLLTFLFSGGAEPPPPFPDCDVDETEDDLYCYFYYYGPCD